MLNVLAGASKRRPRLILVAIAAVLVAGAVAAIGVSAWNSAPPSGDHPGTLNPRVTLALDSVSAPSKASAVALTAGDRNLEDVLSHGQDKLGAVTLIHTSGDRTYYRIENATGRACYGIGPGANGDALAQVVCQHEFPSAEFPVIDMSVADTAGKMMRVEGFAADGITAVRTEAKDGTVIQTAPVVDNVYLMDPVKAPDQVYRVVVVTKDDEAVAITGVPGHGA